MNAPIDAYDRTQVLVTRYIDARADYARIMSDPSLEDLLIIDEAEAYLINVAHDMIEAYLSSPSKYAGLMPIIADWNDQVVQSLRSTHTKE